MSVYLAARTIPLVNWLGGIPSASLLHPQRRRRLHPGASLCARGLSRYEIWRELRWRLPRRFDRLKHLVSGFGFQFPAQRDQATTSDVRSVRELLILIARLYPLLSNSAYGWWPAVTVSTIEPRANRSDSKRRLLVRTSPRFLAA